jgi:hypothetical protein
MKKILTIILLFIGINSFAQKNHYSTAVGLKFSPTAISARQFVGHSKAFEVNLYLPKDQTRLVVLYEMYNDIRNTRMQWYYGYGAHYGRNYIDNSIGFGPDVTLGLDYKMKRSPIDVSLAFQPSMELNGGAFSGWGGFGIRYTLQNHK